MGLNETNPVLRAMDEITAAMADTGATFLKELTRRQMPERIAWAAIIQSTVAALVALELMRLKKVLPETDMHKIAEDMEQIRAKTKKALQDAVLEVARKYDPDIGAVRDVAWQDYLGEGFSWPEEQGPRKPRSEK